MLQKFQETGLFPYTLKLGNEAAWAAVTAATAVIWQVVQQGDAPQTLGEWQTWGLALGTAVARAVIAAVFGKTA